jgi:peptidoglycan/LPS O-acetylase OafA/YrhL
MCPVFVFSIAGMSRGAVDRQIPGRCTRPPLCRRILDERHGVDPVHPELAAVHRFDPAEQIVDPDRCGLRVCSSGERPEELDAGVRVPPSAVDPPVGKACIEHGPGIFPRQSPTGLEIGDSHATRHAAQQCLHPERIMSDDCVTLVGAHDDSIARPASETVDRDVRDSCGAGTVLAMTSRRVPALDGLRGLAVLLVIGFHAELPGFHGGFLGVSMFFTLSGFLITRLLLDETDRTGSIDLRSFWERRFRRLLPAALVCIAAVAAFHRNIGHEIASAVVYIANWQQISSQSPYSAMFATKPLLVHFWSLAVEEQFYLLWPLLVWLAVRRFGQRGPVIALGFGATLSVLGYLGAIGDTQRVYLGTDTRAAEILIGAGLALAFNRARTRAVLDRLPRWVPVVAVIAVTASIATTSTGSSWVYLGGLIPFAVAVGVLIAASVSGHRSTRMLEHPALRACGTVSYGLYLYHWPIFATIGTDTVMRCAVSFALTTLAAIVSYHLIEHPVRTGRVPGRVYLPAVATASILLLAFPGRSGVVAAADKIRGVEPPCYYGDRCGPLNVALVDAPAPDGARPVRVVVFGDSVAQVTAWGLDASAAAAAGDIEVVGLGAGGCPLIGDSHRWYRTGNGSWNKRCRIDDALAKVATYRPDVIIAVFTVSNQVDLQVDGSWTSIEETRGRDALIERMESVAALARRTGATLLWASAPPWREPSTMFDLAVERTELHNEAIDRFLSTHPEVGRFPLAERYADLPLLAFRDGLHLEQTEAISAADTWQVPQILDAAR